VTNEELIRTHFEELELNFDVAQRRVIEIFHQGLFRQDDSHHYELFAALCQKIRPSSILEIGTFHGHFAEFLALLSPDSKIVTFELPQGLPGKSENRNYDITKSHYGEDVPRISSERVKKYSNVIQIFSDSSFLLDARESFDLVWVDGDRSFPVIAFDVINALRLLTLRGVMCIDDVRFSTARMFPMGSKTSNLSSDEPIKTLNYLKSAGLITYSLLPKRIRDLNSTKRAYNPKYIAVVRRTSKRGQLE
jgi:predicted O-methyltransferase YrrM